MSYESFENASPGVKHNTQKQIQSLTQTCPWSVRGGRRELSRCYWSMRGTWSPCWTPASESPRTCTYISPHSWFTRI